MGYKKQVFRSLAMVTQLGISVMTPIFLCMAVGYWADKHFGTKTILIFLVLGVLAGGRCGYHMAKITFLAGEKDDRKEKEEQRKSQKEPAYAPVSRPKPVSRVKHTDEAAASLPGESGLSAPGKDSASSVRNEAKKMAEEGND